MNLAVLNLTGGGLSGGYRKYLERLIPLLAQHPSIDQLSVFVPPGMEKLIRLPGQLLHAWPSKERVQGYPWLKQRMLALSPDVIFIPTARSLKAGRIPVVNMIRNMEPLSVPFAGNPLPEVIKNVLRWYAARRATQQADRIIAVSRHVRDFLLSQWRTDPGKVGVVYHGIDRPEAVAPFSASNGRRDLNPAPFIFTAGSIRPARGLEDIIFALGQMKKRGVTCRLVIAGAVDQGMESYKRKMDRLSERSGIRSQITWAGPLSPEDMSCYYRRCGLFLMTSRAEACPNIVLEAMAHGCVSVSTDTPPMPEIFGAAAVYYPAKNAAFLAGTLCDVLAWEEQRRITMSEQALARAGQFSWRLCAEETVRELNETVHSFQKGRSNA